MFPGDLKSEKLDVTVARSGSEGLLALREKAFSVVISDFHMPGMDGISFLEEVSRISPDSVRILISGRGDFNMAIDVINRVPGLQVAGAHVKEKLRDMQIDCRAYAHTYGVDIPEINDWVWPY